MTRTVAASALALLTLSLAAPEPIAGQKAGDPKDAARRRGGRRRTGSSG